MAITIAKAETKWMAWLQLVLAMLVVQVFSTGLQLLSRVILTNGTFIFALTTYRFVVAVFCVAPLALYFERSDVTKLKKFTIWLWLFLNSTMLTMAFSLLYYGIRDTTANYATDFLNLVPIVTFILSIILGIEELRLGSNAGKAKIAGAFLCVGGALITTLYKGKAFHFYIPQHSTHYPFAIPNGVKTDWTRGTLFLIGSCFSYATFYLMQVKVKEVSPSKYWTTMITCTIASAQSTIVGLIMDRHMAIWKLGWNLELLTIVYSGMLATAATYCLLIWAISKRGPSYPLMFNPLGLVFVVILEALILGTEIHLGAILGMILIILGLYLFVWSKNKETENKSLPPMNE